MDQSLESLAARVAALEDREAIRALKARYLRACDLKQPDVLRETLLPEGAVIAYEGFPAFTDREPFVATFTAMACNTEVFDLHHATNAEIDFSGPDEATGKWSLHFKTILLAQRTIITMGVEYTDRYVRRDGRWWIAETRTTRPFCLVEAVDEAGKPSYVAIGEAPASYG
ncbi:MAG: nuclear transport factor 2 family protein [Novosphingobium sp.]